MPDVKTKELPESLKALIESGHAPQHVIDRVASGQDGRGPRSKQPKVDVREFVKSLQV